jgi:hypothetical protein
VLPRAGAARLALGQPTGVALAERRGLPPGLAGKSDCTREVLTLSELTGSILPLRHTLTCRSASQRLHTQSLFTAESGCRDSVGLPALRPGLFHDLVPKAMRIAALVNPLNLPIAEPTLRNRTRHAVR